MIFRHPVSFYWKVFKDAISDFSDKDIFTHAAALSYYTIFSLPPILLVTIYTATIFYSQKEVEDAVFGQIGSLIGRDSAAQLTNIIENIGVFDGGWWASTISIGILLFTSTTVLITMQNTLNKIFNVKIVAEGWWSILKLVRDRILSFGFVIGFAFVMMVSLIIHALVGALANYIEFWMGTTSTIFVFLFSEFITTLIIGLMFAAIFKWLPDVNIKWRDTVIGAAITAILFTLGKFGISFYIGSSNAATMYDAAGGLIVLMIWVFWASIIFFFGASYTAARVRLSDRTIPAVDYAVKIKTKEIEIKP